MLLAVAVPVLAVGYRDVAFASLVIFILAGMSAGTWRRREDWILGATGAALGPLAELAATSSGLWAYAAPSVGPLPLWAFAMWWIYPVAVSRLVGSVTRRDPARTLPVSQAALLALVTVAWLCAFGSRQPVIAFAGTALLLVAIVGYDRSQETIGRLIVCGLIGPAAEVWPVAMGAWSYPSSAVFGMPLWLATGYGVFGWSLIEVGRGLHHRLAAGATWADPGYSR